MVDIIGKVGGRGQNYELMDRLLSQFSCEDCLIVSLLRLFSSFSMYQKHLEEFLNTLGALPLSTSFSRSGEGLRIRSSNIARRC